MSDYTDIVNRDLWDNESILRWSTPSYPRIKVLTDIQSEGTTTYLFFDNIGNLHHVLEFETMSEVCNSIIYNALIEADKIIEEEYKQYLKENSL